MSLLVSAIYVTVSYRLSSDIIFKAEFKNLAHTTALVDKVLLQNTSHTNGANSEFIRHLLNTEPNVPSVLQVNTQNYSSVVSHLLNDEESLQLLNLVHEQVPPEDQSEQIVTLNSKSYIWFIDTSGSATITYVKEMTLLNATFRLLAKRFLITSIIVFWIAVWLALTLSSIIAKRADDVNAALTELATHDPLTGLPNRLYLNQKIANLSGNEKDSDKISEASLLVIDLDKFKAVNDSFGHSTGDKLLVAVTERILTVVKAPCELIRLGGDEFVVWAPEMGLVQGKQLAKDIIAVCDTTILLNGLEINTGTSVGVAHYPTHTDNTEILMSCADNAMYNAKKQRNGWQVYEKKSELNHQRDIMLKADLNGAMLNRELVLHFQPKVDMRTGEIVGVEALCRWQHPQLGLLMPAEFIDLIEHSGKVQDFGRYIIEQAIIHASNWRLEGVSTPIALNLSPYNLLDPKLASFITQTLNEHHLPANFIQIELTENETCLNIMHIQSGIDKIRQIGIEIAIDDFGTGMSSLAYLDNLKANTIKIDKTFISDLVANKQHRAIVSSAVSLAKSFGCNIVAEGVETKGQAELLISLGCYVAQGYYYAKPMTEDAIKHLINEGVSV
ncbi:hypothetical protein D210916BOD24_33880 [Alteromonas sp. D210916BOD_24]